MFLCNILWFQAGFYIPSLFVFFFHWRRNCGGIKHRFLFTMAAISQSSSSWKDLSSCCFLLSKKRALPLEGNYILQAHIILETKAPVYNAAQLSSVACLAIELHNELEVLQHKVAHSRQVQLKCTVFQSLLWLFHLPFPFFPQFQLFQGSQGSLSRFNSFKVQGLGFAGA